MSPFHEGERAVQRRAGLPAQADHVAARVLRSRIEPVAAEFLASPVMVLVGHRQASGAVWASVLSGGPGFVWAPDEMTVWVEATPREGDPLEQMVDSGSTRLGLLATDPPTLRRMRVNGTGQLTTRRLMLQVEQVFANCPKYIHSRRPVTRIEGQGSRPSVRRSKLSEADRRHLMRADTFFIASHHRAGGIDVSHRGGRPGFVQVEGDRRLVWADYKGNGLFMTLGNLSVDPSAGLLVPDWETGAVLQLTGTAHVLWDSEDLTGHRGAERLVEFRIAEAVSLSGALGWQWELGGYSRWSP